MLRLLNLLTLSVVLLSVILVGCGQGSGDAAIAGPVLTDADGVAIQGYDAVAYFVDNRPNQGSPEYGADWNGARWWFSSAENRDLFLSDPESFAPAYGGWCAYGMAEGYAAETDPVNGWTIHEGRLYLNWDAEITADWRADKAGFLKKSEAQWPEVEGQLQDGSATVYWHEG